VFFEALAFLGWVHLREDNSGRARRVSACEQSGARA
jgi:hypothetical protein